VTDRAGSQPLVSDGRQAILIDRDGTLIVECDYLGDPSLVELEEGAIEALARLRDAGWALVMVSNQSGVARGYFSEADMRAVNRAVVRLLEDSGLALDGVYCCIHGLEDRCECRKPAPGLLLEAAQELGLDLTKSVMIGDKRSDLEAAANAGASAILVMTGHGASNCDWALSAGYPVASGLTDAAAMILDNPPSDRADDCM
jgi:D-glycero-D-manno-heptose 1,7-bisphosphate phosphatase